MPSNSDWAYLHMRHFYCGRRPDGLLHVIVMFALGFFDCKPPQDEKVGLWLVSRRGFKGRSLSPHSASQPITSSNPFNRHANTSH